MYKPPTAEMIAYLDFSVSTTGMLTGVKVRHIIITLKHDRDSVINLVPLFAYLFSPANFFFSLLRKIYFYFVEKKNLIV